MPRDYAEFRLSSNVFSTFLVIGCYVPFLPVWLQGRGLNADQIGMIFAAALWAKIPVGLLISSLADHSGQRKWLLLAIAGATLAGFLSFPLLDGFTAILIGWIFVGTLLTTMIPLSDSLAVTAIRRFDLNYGRIRRWGSISFIGVSIIGGAWLDGRDSEAVLSLLIATSAVMVISTVTLPDLREQPRPGRRPALFDLIRSPTFMIFVVTAATLQASHAALYGFATLQWVAAGISKTVIGLLWAEGVLVEIGLLTFASAVLRHVGVPRLLMLAGVAGIVRWSVLGTTSWLPALVAVQALHALTFAGTLVAAIGFISKTVPADQSATAQGLYDGLAMGLIFGFAMAIAGRAYADSGAAVFYVMAALSAGGVAGAVLLQICLRQTRPGRPQQL